MADMTKRGIFCIETPTWFGDTDRRSMRPILQLLHDVYGTHFIHRDATCLEEFYRHLSVWRGIKAGSGGPKEQYPILILGFHGDIDGIHVSDSLEKDDEDDPSFATLEEIADFLEGSCTNKVIHFASCSTINVSNSAVGNFLEKTKASAVSGYAKEVDWTWSIALDLLYLEAIQCAKNKYLRPKLMKEEVSDNLRNGSRADPYPYNELRKDLGFDIRERTMPAA